MENGGLGLSEFEIRRYIVQCAKPAQMELADSKYIDGLQRTVPTA
jgi:hypothetical protein